MRLAVSPHEVNITLFLQKFKSIFHLAVLSMINSLKATQDHPKLVACLQTSSPMAALRAGQAASLAVDGGKKSGVVLRTSEWPDQYVLGVPSTGSCFLQIVAGGVAHGNLLPSWACY